MAGLVQPQGQLGRRGRLARSLKANQHDDVRRRARQVELAGLAQSLDQLLVDDLDHLLAWREGPHHLSADGPLAHPGHEVLDHFVVYVGFQESQSHLAHGGIHVALGELAPLGQFAEHILQLVCQILKHSVIISSNQSVATL